MRVPMRVWEKGVKPDILLPLTYVRICPFVMVATTVTASLARGDFPTPPGATREYIAGDIGPWPEYTEYTFFFFGIQFYIPHMYLRHRSGHHEW
jgi:hypothetical protein